MVHEVHLGKNRRLSYSKIDEVLDMPNFQGNAAVNYTDAETPYTRIIELTFRDSNEGRAVKLAEDLAHVLRKSFDITGPYAPAVARISDQHIRIIRISMKKDRHLSAHKKSVMKTVQEFEKARRYDGHITVNVDPA